MSGGHMPGGQMSGGQMSGGQISCGEILGGQMSGGQISGGQMSGGQIYFVEKLEVVCFPSIMFGLAVTTNYSSNYSNRGQTLSSLGK